VPRSQRAAGRPRTWRSRPRRELYFEIRLPRARAGAALPPRRRSGRRAGPRAGPRAGRKLYREPGSDRRGGEDLRPAVSGHRHCSEKQGNLFGLSLDKSRSARDGPSLSAYINSARGRRPGDEGALPAEMRDRVSRPRPVMRSRRHLRPRRADDFAWNADEVLDFWPRSAGCWFVALPGLVAISLVVGGIVIMNIMLKTAESHPRESGFASRSARRRDILRQSWSRP